MNIVEQHCKWIQPPLPDALQLIERAGRTCYKSEDKITPESAVRFVRGIMSHDPPHESVIEHIVASMLFVTDRGVTHEIVRHRIASYSQESTRYCNYCKDQFGKELTFIWPVFWKGNTADPEKSMIWQSALGNIELAYMTLIELGATAQEARSVLPNSLKTEIVMTANMREWRHFFKLRCSPKAHPQMQDLAKKALGMFQERVPVLFDDLCTQYILKEPQ